MSTLSNYQRPRTSSKTRKNSTILCSEVTPHKMKKPHPTLRKGNSHQTHRLYRFMGNLLENLPKSCAKQNSPCLEIRQKPCTSCSVPLRKKSHYTETSQMVWNANQLTDFYKRRAPTERYFRTDLVLLCGLWTSSYRQ